MGMRDRIATAARCWGLVTCVVLLTGVNWDGVRVLPKRASLRPVESPIEKYHSAPAGAIEWPATVRRSQGQWLEVGDTGGYSAQSAVGWVRKDDIVRVDEAQGYCTGKIQELAGDPRVAAEYYWLRGIYWELHDELDNALDDLNAAQAGNLDSGDLRLRKARVLARLAGQHVALETGLESQSFQQALAEFASAGQAFARQGLNPPQLAIGTGDAYYDRYRQLGEAADAAEALRQYRLAERANPSWFVPPYKQGRLHLRQFKTQEKQEIADRKLLLAAVDRFSQSIRLNPNWLDSYRERAEALWELSESKGIEVAGGGHVERLTSNQGPAALHTTQSLPGSSDSDPPRVIE